MAPVTVNISVWADCRQILRIEDGKTVIAKAPARPPRLVSIHANDDSTPTLGTRSSTSVLRQQFSSPLPIAYLAGKLAGVSKDVDVYEPTAGNGALLLLIDLAKAITRKEFTS